MLASLREAFTAFGRAVRGQPAPVIADPPLPDPLDEEMRVLEARVAERQRRAMEQMVLAYRPVGHRAAGR
jgi:hypothetical protein